MAAANQSFEQGSALTRRTNDFVSRAIGCQPILVGLEALPTDVRREPVADQHQALLGRADTPTRAWPARLFPTRIAGPIPVAIGACIDRMMQQVLQSFTARTMPFQLTSVGTAVRPHRQANLVMDQIT